MVGASASTKRSQSASPKVERVEIGAANAGQRIDNFLIRHLKGVPKTRLYRALRNGEVRVNGARKKPPYALQLGDELRIPPLRRSQSAVQNAAKLRVPDSLLQSIAVLWEDPHILVVDKPSGLAVHGGSGVAYGLIEGLRKLRPELAYLELAHRLDRETSGCLLLAKSRAALLNLHAQFGAPGEVKKEYTALLYGAWDAADRSPRKVDIPLPRGNFAQGVRIAAHSVFTPLRSFAACTLVSIRLRTGRTHQARLHAAAISQPIAGDYLHGAAEFNAQMKQLGLKRLFLHATRLGFTHPADATPMTLHAPLPTALAAVLDKL